MTAMDYLRTAVPFFMMLTECFQLYVQVYEWKIFQSWISTPLFIFLKQQKNFQGWSICKVVLEHLKHQSDLIKTFRPAIKLITMNIQSAVARKINFYAWRRHKVQLESNKTRARGDQRTLLKTIAAIMWRCKTSQFRELQSHKLFGNWYRRAATIFHTSEN